MQTGFRFSFPLSVGLAVLVQSLMPLAHAVLKFEASMRVIPFAPGTPYSGAKCNDGRPATYYVRLASAPTRKWVIHLQGGGGCGNELSCMQRWYDSTGQGDEIIGSHATMIPETDPSKEFDGLGVLDDDGYQDAAGVTHGLVNNPFASYNKIFIPYCSSDNWSGLGTLVPVSSQHLLERDEKGNLIENDEGFAALNQIHFGGASIVDAVISLVMRGEAGDPGSPADLTRAPRGSSGEIVLTGSSAGSLGVIRNLDQVAHDVKNGTSNFSGDRRVRVWGVSDSGSLIGIVSTAQDNGDDEYARILYYSNGNPSNARVEYGCRLNVSNRCYASSSLALRDEITTPYFIVNNAADEVRSGPRQNDIALRLTEGYLQPSAQPGIERTYADLFTVAYDRANAPFLGQAQDYIRYAMTHGARSAGVARNNHAGVYMPNHARPKHELIKTSDWFFKSVGDSIPDIDDPRWGFANPGMNVAQALTHFRSCLYSHSPGSGRYNACVDAANNSSINTTASYGTLSP